MRKEEPVWKGRANAVVPFPHRPYEDIRDAPTTAGKLEAHHETLKAIGRGPRSVTRSVDGHPPCRLR